ncbi:hypothetical protein ACFL1Y_00330 [Patescibacteria group bacterium]
MKNKKHHLIFEGAELVGKSFLTSQIYDILEKKYNSSDKILNGCHWFNCDVGIFGSKNGKKIINEYIKIIEILKDKNVLLEKFYLTDQVYNELYNKKKINYSKQEEQLKKLNTKIILLTVNNKKIFAERITDRLNNVSHYSRVVQKSEDYWQQQEKYLELIKKIKLQYLILDFSTPLDKKFIQQQVNKILEFIKEN